MAIKTLLINGQARDYHMLQKGDSLIFDITDAQGNSKTVTINSKTFDKATGILCIQVDGKPYKAHVSYNKTHKYIAFAHTPHEFTVQDVQPVIKQEQNFSFIGAHAGVKPAPISDLSVFKSPLAGRISKLFVTPAQFVNQGQPIILIESRKMENEICAPRAAFIKTILIAEGNVVQPEQVLIEFENEGEGNAVAKSSHEPQAVQDR